MFSSKPDASAKAVLDNYSDKDPMSSHIQIGDTLSNSVICRKITIVGNAYSEGDVLIEGNFVGDIQAASLRIGPLAQVQGNFKAKEIFISGQLEGTIMGGRVVLDKDACIEGDIYHESLSIEDGAIFKGKSYQAKYDGVDADSKAGAATDTPSPSTISAANTEKRAKDAASTASSGQNNGPATL